MLSDLERRALKSVTGLAVKKAGGQENAVHVVSRIARAAALSDYANPRIDDRYCPIDVALELDQFNGDPVILRALARMAGHALVKLPEVAETDSPLGKVTARTLREVADVFSTLGAQLEDGALDQAEGVQLDKEIDEAVETLLAMKLQAHAVIERGGK